MARKNYETEVRVLSRYESETNPTQKQPSEDFTIFLTPKVSAFKSLYHFTFKQKTKRVECPGICGLLLIGLWFRELDGNIKYANHTCVPEYFKSKVHH